MSQALLVYLARATLQGTVKGRRKRGRQKKRWEDNMYEWTGVDFASSTRAAEQLRTGQGGKRFLLSHFVVPQ